jgi:DNA polymerase-3 subunit gamma/tau
MHPEFVQLAYQFALQGYRDLPLTPDPRTGFEMVLLRMLAFRPARAREFPSAAKPSTLEDSSNEDHHRPIDTQQSSIGPLDTRSSGADSSIESRTKAQSSLAQQRPSGEHPNTEDPPWVSDPEPEPEPQHLPQTEPLLDQVIDPNNGGDPTAKASQLAEVAATQDVFGINVDDDADRDDSSNDQQFTPKIEVTPGNWSEVFDQLNLHGMTGGFASQMALLRQQNLCWSFVTTPDILRLITEVHRHRIETSLRQVTQLALQVEITASDTMPETPLQRRDRLHAEHLALAKSAFV